MSDQEFRWQAFFQRCTEPLFVLNRQQYLLHANPALQQLTNLSAKQLKRLSCRRQEPAPPGSSWRKVLAHILTPPPEVLKGAPARHRRLVPAQNGRRPCWWDIDFLPVADAD